MTVHETILGCHVYDARSAERFARAVEPLLVVADRVELTSSRPEALEAARTAFSKRHARVHVTEVDNTYHDWSGYLSLLGHTAPYRTVIVCNDSLVNRRILLARTRKRFVDAVAGQTSALVGELDTARQSVVIGGATSVGWISTYLFAVCGYAVGPAALQRAVEAEMDAMHPDTELYFEQNLAWRRGSMVAPDVLRPKMAAMVFERLLTMQAMAAGHAVIDYCDSDYVRKLERLAERFKNDRG